MQHVFIGEFNIIIKHAGIYVCIIVFIIICLALQNIAFQKDYLQNTHVEIPIHFQLVVTQDRYILKPIKGSGYTKHWLES